MSLLALAGANSAVAAGYDIDNSLKFEDDNDERMSKAISSTNQKTHTISLWLKRTELGYRRTWGTGQSGLNEYFFYFDANDYLNIYSYASAYQLRFISNRVFRDTSAWYHLVFAIDTTQSTEADRVKIYVNGIQETSWSTSTYPSQNTDLQIFDKIYVGTQRNENPDFSGYISEFVYLDGTQAAVTDFGEFDEDTGIWKPIDVSGLSFGTNGCYLKFNNSSDLGEDANGGTSFTLNNITSADQATDTPTNIFCNFQTPVWLPSGTSVTITEGATKAVTSVNEQKGQGNMGVANGKWYFEMQVPSGESSSDFAVGFGEPNLWYGTNPVIVGDSNGYSFGVYNGGTWRYNGTTTSTDAVSYAVGDIVMFAMDSDNGKAYMGKNGTWAGTSNPATGSGGFDWDANVTNLSTGDMLIPVFRLAYLSGNDLYSNWGGYTVMSIASGNADANGYGNFEYAPPSGYYAMCTKNLAEYG